VNRFEATAAIFTEFLPSYYFFVGCCFFSSDPIVPFHLVRPIIFVFIGGSRGNCASFDKKKSKKRKSHPFFVVVVVVVVIIRYGTIFVSSTEK